MAIGKDKTRIIVTLPDNIKNKLDIQAQKENRPVANLVANLIVTYLTQIDNLEKQQYYDFLCNCFLQNVNLYNSALQDMNSSGLVNQQIPPFQLNSYLKNFLIANRRNELDNFAQFNGITFEDFTRRTNNMNNPYQITMFPNL